ncbi:MAG TPA: DUF1080 domain-containing protein [Candidatus Hydrogenedentes bacterium]|nr:DUF1080 domain-containing protein [Candidatus Hydrogenedentota bacterium]
MKATLRIVVIVMVLCVTASVMATAQDAKKAAASEKPGKIELFNGKDLTGWELFTPDKNVDPKTIWSVQDGVLHCKGEPRGYCRTTKKYSDYKLTFQWRWPEKGGNSGLLMHISTPDKVWPRSIEGQLACNDAADFWVIDGTDFKEHTDKSDRRVLKKFPSNERPLGEWNTMIARCQGNTIWLWVNGLLQNKATETTVTEGYIGLQSEGTPIEFRNIILEPLK